MKRILYIEPFSGISGDMFAGALLELSPNPQDIFEKIMSLQTSPGFSLSGSKVNKNGITATKFDVKIDGKNDNYFTHGCSLYEIIRIIDNAEKIPPKAKELAKRIFYRLATAESKIHGMETNQVHFHEIGAVDSIVDIVTASLLVTELNIAEVISSPPALGNGTINTMHGVLPVPAPATAEILKGLPFTPTNVHGELTTPTGAAILAELVNKWGTPESGVLKLIGYGAGSKNYPDQANVLRVSIFEECSDENEADRVAVIETNIDDMPGEFLTQISKGLLALGVLDYAIIPATMKKNRQGYILQIICKTQDQNKVTDYILKNTTTIGIRYRLESRRILKRESLIIETSFGKIRVKLSGSKNDGTYKIKPELDDIAKIAEERNLSFLQLYSEITSEIYLKMNK